jgi:DNA (cytosine-5)-methyltransferase 1
LSFFSGALGLDLGFEEAGYECLSLNEVDPVACKTIKANLATAFRQRRKPELFDYDIRRLSSDFIRDQLGIDTENLFCIIGGPPCQAFSTAGKRLGLNDERGNVFLHFIHLVGQLRPKYVVFENVRGILSAPLIHRPHNERGSDYPPLTTDEQPGGALLKILDLLSQYGYKTTFNLYNTANFGVPQKRERVIFFASREGKEVPFMRPTHDAVPKSGLAPWMTLEQVLSSIEDPEPEAAHFPERRLKYYKLLGPGENWRNLPPHAQKKAMGKSWFSGGGKTGFYRRLSLDKPAPTLVTTPTMPATDLCHPTELRPLSIAEYRAIQTFPISFELAGKTADKYRQLGNAVPVRFARAVAQHLLDFDAGKLKNSTAQRQFSRYIATDHLTWRRPAAAS